MSVEPGAAHRHQRLYIRGKGAEREVPVPEETLAALKAWLGMHPLSRGSGLRDEQPGSFGSGAAQAPNPPKPLSAQAVHKIVRRCALAADVPERLAHPHALRTYWATSLLEDGVAIHRVSSRLGHADLRTTSRYAAERPDQVDDIADVMDCRHEFASGLGPECRARLSTTSAARQYQDGRHRTDYGEHDADKEIAVD